jgi:hypothetical protein
MTILNNDDEDYRWHYNQGEKEEIARVKCPFCDLKLKDDGESLAMHIEIGHILPNYVPVSKIEALPYDDWCDCRTCLGLQDLLKEKEKPEQ